MTKKRKRKFITYKEDPEWTPFFLAAFPEDDPTYKRRLEDQRGFVGVYRNSLFQITVYFMEAEKELNSYTWLVIRRVDSEPVRDWRHLQRIKNELCGPECEAVEIYPAESRLVDTSNQYHLFVMEEGARIPFGYMERMVSDTPFGKNKQRPFDVRPADLNAIKPTDDMTKIYSPQGTGEDDGNES